MFSIAIIDILGLTYDGTTLSKRGLGGSESAVILMSRELSKLGFSVTVFNNCSDRQASEGIYDDVNYIDITRLYQDNNYKFDIVISSRTLLPFVNEMNWGNFNPNPKFFKQLKDNAKLKIVWMHDTFCGGDHLLEEHLVNGDIDEIFTLSDFHTSYVTSCAHGPKRNFEVLKDKVFITRNGIVNYFDEVDISKKDRNLFVYNASVTKGMLPLVRNIWERVKQKIPDAKLKVIGGYYRFRENAEPDEQEKTWRELIKDSKYSNLHIEFTGIITQKEIAEILSNASYMIYPGAFPETFGISSLESLCYNTPLITTRFGALEETAIEQASYFIDYAIEPNSLYPHINQQLQEDRFVNLVLSVYNNPYLHQQKMYYCNIIKDVCGWDTVALQWKQHLYKKFNSYLPIEEYRKVQDINYKIHKIFGRMHSNKEEWYEPKRSEQRISVVSTFYNAENFIEKCILSVASQNYDNYCHILVNDCSTDNSQFVAEKAIQSLPKNIQSKFILINRKENEGAVYNQVMTFRDPFIKDDDIVMILDGDDWLVNEPDVFDFYNNLYQNDETEFSYGSCWSVVDNIPLISQPYPKNILEKRAYRQHKFNWGLPYTHLRTFRKRLINNVNDSVFLDEKRNWFRAGGDVATFYNIIEQADPKKVKCVSRIVYNYNDANPLNDYKVNSSEQNRNADMIANKNHKFSIIVPTMWRCKELFKKCLDRIVEHPLIDEILIINNEVQSTPNWSVLANSKIKMKNQSENIKVNKAWNLGLKESRNDIICLMNDDILFDEKLFEKIKDRIVPESGVYGLITGEAKFKHPTLTDGSIDFVEWKPKDNIHGFGQLMFLHKSNWKPIIDGLEIYFGDDYIFHNQLVKNLKNYLITNICWESPMAATTSDEKITEGVYERERPFWRKYFMENPLPLNSILLEKYKEQVNTYSDINHHLPKLFELAQECETVTEMGVRFGVSSTAFLASKARLLSYDIEETPQARDLFNTAKKIGKECQYIADINLGDSLKIEIEPTDMLFIDTLHSYDQLYKELNRHHSKVKKYISFHDTHIFGYELNHQAPVHAHFYPWEVQGEHQKGLLHAIIDFLIDHPEWKWKYHSTKNNGLSVIERVNKQEVKKQEVKKKILVAIPTAKYIESQTFKSIFDLSVPDNYEIDFQYFYGYNIDQVRNLIAHWAVNYDYLFSVDSDIAFEKDTLKKLLSHDKDMVTGLYVQRKENQKILEIYQDNNKGGVSNISLDKIAFNQLIKISSCGFGCVLVKSEVIRKIGYPQFVYKSAINHENTISEDIYFCKKAIENGFEIYADTSIICEHIGTYKFKVR